jgi:hypothetical protein
MTAEVKVRSADNRTGLQTLCADGAGRVYALVAPPRTFAAPLKDGFGEVHVFDAANKPVMNWRVGFHAHSINVAPNGTVLVAGDGWIARFDRNGKAMGDPVELPHIADLFRDKDALRKKSEEQIKREKETMLQNLQQARKQIEERISKIESKKPEERTKTEERQLEQYKAILKSYESMEKDQRGRTVDVVIQQMTGRARIINGIAVSEKDVFIACGDVPGFGYAIWRMDLDLKNARKVLDNLGGCCGQMDIQVHGSDLLVAENTRHRFGRYDRDGKPLGHFGKKGDKEPDCFGGCCNPMNLRAAGAAGDIFTAESEGIIKRFSPRGDFLATVGVVKLTGGCKNVAVAVAGDGSKVYLCDQPGSRFVVLTARPAAGQ